MVWLGQYRLAVVLLSVCWCNVAIAQNAHVFGSDFAAIQPITALVTAVSIALGVALRWILGQPDPKFPLGKRGVIAQIMFGVVSGIIGFVICDTYRYGFLEAGEDPRALLDGIQALIILIFSYNSKDALEKVSDFFEDGIDSVARRWLGRKTGE